MNKTTNLRGAGNVLVFGGFWFSESQMKTCVVSVRHDALVCGDDMGQEH